jgi:hypothetical protein
MVSRKRVAVVPVGAGGNRRRLLTHDDVVTTNLTRQVCVCGGGGYEGEGVGAHPPHLSHALRDCRTSVFHRLARHARRMSGSNPAAVATSTASQ